MKNPYLRITAGLWLVIAFAIAAVHGPLAGALVAMCGGMSLSLANPRFGALNPAAALTLDKLMRDAIRALKKRLSPVLALSTVMRDQVLTETDTVQVPFYSLDTLASKDFDGEYDFTGADASNATRPVIVNKRKYQPLEFTSKQLARNSAIDLNMVMMLKVEKLAEDVLNDIFSVVTAANYGAAIFTGASSAFAREDLSDMRVVLNQAHWPAAGRSLILESAYEGALVKEALSVQTPTGDDVRREGSTGRMVGFDLFEHPNMPANAEHLVGLACLPYAILTAFAPIEPAPEVRQNLSEYRRYTDPATGLTLEYRAWGNPDSDSARRTVEVSYGYAKGDAAQGKRLVSA